MLRKFERGIWSATGKPLRVIAKLPFLLSIVAYIAVAYLLPNEAVDTMTPQTVRTLVLALGVVFVLQALLAALVLPRLMAANRKGLMMVQMAVYEAGAIMGLVLALLTHDPIYTVYFGVPSFALILFTK